MKVTLRQFHKWVGIGIGVVLLLWIGTGVVMVLPHAGGRGQPVTTEWATVTTSPAEAVLAASEDGTPVANVTLHRVADVVVYRLHAPGQRIRLVDARTGHPLTVDSALAVRAARAALGTEGSVRDMTRIEAYDARYSWGTLPAYRITFDDGSGTVAYVGIDDGSVNGGGMQHRVRGIIAGLHTFYPLRVLARSARIEVGLLLLACVVATAAVLTGYWMALPRRLRAWPGGRR